MSDTDLTLRRANPAQYWRDLLHRAQRRTDEQPAGNIPTTLRPGSPVLEACRVLRVNLAPRQSGACLPPLLLLAAAPDPSCTLVAAGLAVALAEERRKTLLVDADLRNPQLDGLFGLDGSIGLRNMISAGSAQYPAIPQVSDTLWVLPTGRTPREDANLFRRAELATVVGELAARFDTVIYTLSSQTNSPDALLLGLQVGKAVLAVRVGVDTAESIRRIKEPLERAGVDILGFTLVGGAS